MVTSEFGGGFQSFSQFSYKFLRIHLFRHLLCFIALFVLNISSNDGFAELCTYYKSFWQNRKWMGFFNNLQKKAENTVYGLNLEFFFRLRSFLSLYPLLKYLVKIYIELILKDYMYFLSLPLVTYWSALRGRKTCPTYCGKNPSKHS